MLQKNWMDWKQELDFLSQIDDYRFSKYFLKRYIEDVFYNLHINISSTSTYTNISDLSLVSGINTGVLELENGELSSITILYCRMPSYFSSYMDIDIHKCIKLIRHNQKLYDKYIDTNQNKYNLVKGSVGNKKVYHLKLLKLIDITNVNQGVLEIVNSNYRNLFEFYKDKCSYMKSEENKTTMLDF